MSEDAKPYKTAEIESWFDIDMNVELARLRATTRALETAQTALVMRSHRTVEEITRAEKAEKELIGVHKVLIDVHDALHRECDGTANLPDEIRALRRERDEARQEVARRDALIARDGYEDMRQHAVGLAQRLEKAERERDEARAEETALLEQRDRARRALAAEIETTRATKARVAELAKALGAIVSHWDADDEGKVHPDLIDAARAALAKAKGGAS